MGIEFIYYNASCEVAKSHRVNDPLVKVKRFFMAGCSGCPTPGVAHSSCVLRRFFVSRYAGEVNQNKCIRLKSPRLVCGLECLNADI